MNPARIDREDERRMLPCRNFLDGFCPKGSRCRFYHPVPSAIPTVIRVPNLPSSFQQNNQGRGGHFPGNSVQHAIYPLSKSFKATFQKYSFQFQYPVLLCRTFTFFILFELGPSPSSRTRLGINSKLGMGTPSRFLGMNGLSNNYSRGMSTPASPTYSEYEMAYAQQMEIQKEKERRAAAPSVSETDENLQNTVFSHIDWKEFLAPGVRPPPPTHVPYMRYVIFIFSSSDYKWSVSKHTGLTNKKIFNFQQFSRKTNYRCVGFLGVFDSARWKCRDDYFSFKDDHLKHFCLKLDPMIDPLSEPAMDKRHSPKIREYSVLPKSVRAFSNKEELYDANVRCCNLSNYDTL